jgi:hypothetical protein
VVAAIAVFVSRYIADRFLPDKVRGTFKNGSSNWRPCCSIRPAQVHAVNTCAPQPPTLPPLPCPQAIDLVDEAAAKLKMEITSKPEALDEIDRKVSEN